MSIWRKITDRSDLIIFPPTPPATNNPPQWDSQPSLVFVNGTSSSFDMDDITSDPDLDAITHSLNTGAVSLPTGVTWTAATGVLSYDGTDNVTTTTGHIFTIDDGTDSVDSDSSSITISSWPANGAHAQAGINVASLANNIDTNPGQTWNAKKDIIFIQGTYPFSSRVTTTFNSITTMRAINPNLKVLEYTFNERADNVGNTNGLPYLYREAVDDNSAGAKWYAIERNSSSALYYSDPTASTPNYRQINPHFGGMQSSNGFDDYADALVAKYDNATGSGGPQDLRALLDGHFDDETDFTDTFGRLYDDLGNRGEKTDYLKPGSSGGTNSKLYRQGRQVWHTSWQATFGSDQAAASNGGRDSLDDVNLIPTDPDFEWAAFWDYRIKENFDNTIKLEPKSGSDSTLEITASSSAAVEGAFLNGIKSLLIGATMVNQTSTNALGKGLVAIDFVFDWGGAMPAADSDISQEFYEAARFVCGLACLDDRFIASPNLGRGAYPFPYMDEFVYSPGAAVGGTPSIGSIDESTTAFTLTLRAADDGGFYWQEYANGLWVVNMTNYPTHSSDWPQGTTDECTLPSAGVGNEWRHASSTHNNASQPNGATDGQDQSSSINDGSLPDGTGLTLTIPRWHARYLVRTAT